MRTREQLNKEWESIQTKIDKEQWVLIGALISMFVGLAGLFIGISFSTFGGGCMILGFLGMIGFGGRASYLSVSKKELQREWNANGYGLNKYPKI